MPAARTRRRFRWNSGGSGRASPELFNDISGYVAEDGQRARLLIGPFHTREDAELFEDALASERITAFSWTSAPGQSVRKID